MSTLLLELVSMHIDQQVCMPGQDLFYALDLTALSQFTFCVAHYKIKIMQVTSNLYTCMDFKFVRATSNIRCVYATIHMLL